MDNETVFIPGLKVVIDKSYSVMKLVVNGKTIDRDNDYNFDGDYWHGFHYNGLSYDINIWVWKTPEDDKEHAQIYRVKDGSTETSTWQEIPIEYE